MCAWQDMRISNIMEHRGDMPYIPKGFKDKKKKKKKNEKPVMLLRGVLSPNCAPRAAEPCICIYVMPREDVAGAREVYHVAACERMPRMLQVTAGPGSWCSRSSTMATRACWAPGTSCRRLR